MSEITCLGVVGGGFMGSGIAESAARAGLSVVIHEPEQAPLDRSRERIEQSVARATRNGKLSEDEATDMLGRITWSTEFEDLGSADAVVEAIIEDARAKGSLF